MSNRNINDTNPYWIRLDVPQDRECVYVQRQEEDIIIKYLNRGELVRVFNARKSGKSSVRNSVIDKLKRINIKCASINLLGFPTDATEEQFYDSIILQINQTLKIRDELFTDYLTQNNYNNFLITIKFSLFFEFLLSTVEDKIIVFIDEIDSLKNLKFSDNFFACLRAIYQKRGQEFQYNRLNFCLLGVAKVSELISDTQITGFNFGKPIELKDFNSDSENIEELIETLTTKELKAKVNNCDLILRLILEQTEGQPYLTIKLLHEIVDLDQNIKEGEEKDKILQLIKTYMTDRNSDTWDEQDYFKHSEQRILEEKNSGKLKNEEKTAQLLNLYQEILEGVEIIWNRNDDTQMDLFLSGIVSIKENLLKPTSPIHETVFDLKWINECFEKFILHWYREKKEAWFKSNHDKHLRDKYYLLYGKELEEAGQKYQEFSLQDEEFIIESRNRYYVDKFEKISEIIEEKIQEKIQEKIDEKTTWYKDLYEKTKEKIVDRLRYWTNYEKDIFDKIIEIINQNIDKPNELTPYNKDFHNEENWVDNLIQTHIIDKRLSINIFIKINNFILNNELSEDKGFKLLVTYGEILHIGKVKFSENNEEQKELINIGLVKRRYNLDDQGFTDLKVINPICETIFNLEYIEENLPENINGRNYGKKFGMWLITRENQYLLTKIEFEEVKNFLHQVNDELEHEFILKSQLRNPLKIDSQ